MSEQTDPPPPLDDLIQIAPASASAPASAGRDDPPPPRSTMDDLGALATPDDGATSMQVPPPPPAAPASSTMGDLAALQRQDLPFDDPNNPEDERPPRSTMEEPTPEDGERLKLLRAATRAAPPSPLEPLMLLDALLAQLRALRSADTDAESMRAAASLLVSGARIPLREAPSSDASAGASGLDALLEMLLSTPSRTAQEEASAAGASSMGDLLAMLGTSQREKGNDASGGGSNMESLLSLLGVSRSEGEGEGGGGGSEEGEAASSMGDLFALLGRSQDRSASPLSPSSMEDVFEIIAAARAAAEGDADTATGEKGGGMSSSMEGLLAILARGREGGSRGGAAAAALRSSLGEALRLAASGRLEVLPERRQRRYAMADDLSKLVQDQPEPRLKLPRRQERTHLPPVADGFTPIPPEEREIQTQLAPGQGCPRRGVAPLPAGELVHERLEFRYNRFERLVVRQTLFECPGCPDVALFHGREPSFLCSHAPLGDGLLAQVVVAVYRDRLPLQRVASLLTDLGAPIPQKVLAEELAAAARALQPMLAELRRDTLLEEPPLTALLRGRERHTPGWIQVRRGKSGQVSLQFFPSAEGGGGIMPKNPAEALAGPRVLARWRGHGRLGRWSDVRQRFFLALLTDPERARRGLALLDRLGTDPHPGTRAAELAALEAWLAAQAADIVAPRNRFEHAVTATRALWPQLSAADDPATRRKLVEAPWTLEADPPGPEADLLWVSLVESCAALGLPLWVYLHDLLLARANDPQFAPKDWTPLARAAHP